MDRDKRDCLVLTLLDINQAHKYPKSMIVQPCNDLVNPQCQGALTVSALVTFQPAQLLFTHNLDNLG